MAKLIQETEDTKLVYGTDDYKKSNQLISAKYKSSLIENKLLALSLSKINEGIVEEVEIGGSKTKVLTSTLFSSEIQKFLGSNKKSLSKQLKDTYVRMAGRQIGIENDKGEFSYRSLIIGADYANGVLKIYYNPLLNTYYQELSKNYTILSLRTMMSFRSVHSFRLYELLKSHCYVSKRDEQMNRQKGSAKTYRFVIEYSLSELKLALGVVNSELSIVKAELSKTMNGHPNYDRAVEVSPEKGFELWSNFKRKVIDPAVKEINDKTEMNITYELQKSGQGGKVRGIEFLVDINNESISSQPQKEDIIEERELTAEEKEEIEDEIRYMLDIKLKTKDIRNICEAANYNVDRIQTAYQIMISQNRNIDNVVGFLISAIKNDYQEPVTAEIENDKQKKASTRKPRARKTAFNNFPQREYDYDELEKQIISNRK